MSRITFGTIAAKGLSASQALLDGKLTYDELLGMRPSWLFWDRDFFAIVSDQSGSADGKLDPGEEAYKMGETLFDRLLLTSQDRTDPIKISAHGRLSAFFVTPLSFAITFDNVRGFGLDNGPDGSAAAKYLNDGDSITFKTTSGYRIEELSFKVDIPGTSSTARTDVVFDFDGNIMDTGIYTAANNLARADYALKLNNIADGARIDVDFVSQKLFVNGARQTGSAVDAFFAEGDAPRKVTVGSLTGKGFSLADVEIERTEIPGHSTLFAAERAFDNGNVTEAAQHILDYSAFINQFYDLGRNPGFFVADQDSSVWLSLFGSSVAVGEHTLSSGQLNATLQQAGDVTLGLAIARFVAYADDPEGNAFAVTDAFAEVLGADIVFLYELFTSTQGPYPDAGFAGAQSTMAVVALDCNRFDFAQGPYVVEIERDGSGTLPNGHLDPGNAAIFEGLVEAFGPNTLASLEVNVLAVQDSLSTVEVVAQLGVGEVFVA